jgi:hypothetical protein
MTIFQNKREKQAISNVCFSHIGGIDKRIMESRNKTPNFCPLFKTTEEALEIIELLKEWNESSSGKRKCVHHSRHEYRLWNK